MSRLKSIVPMLVVILSLSFAVAAMPLKVDAATARFTKSTYKVGKGYKVTLKLKNTKGKKVTWKIGKKAKKRIKVVRKTNNSITVRGKKVGKAIVTARVGTRKAKTIVRIKKKHVTLSAKSLTIKRGSSKKLTVSGAKNATFKSTNKKVVQVRKIGRTKARIIGKKKGSAYIKIKANGKTLRCKVRVKGSGTATKKKSKSPLVKIPDKKNARWYSLQRDIKKNTIKVKISTSLTDKANAAKVRKLWNLPDSTPLYDTVTISLTNNSSKDIAVRHDYSSFGTLYYKSSYNGKSYKVSNSFTSYQDPKEDFGRIAIKAGKTRTQTYKIKNEELDCYYYNNSPYGFYSTKANEPVQVLLSDCNESTPFLYLYFPATGKTSILNGKNYTRREKSKSKNSVDYVATSYLDFRKYKGDKVESKYED